MIRVPPNPPLQRTCPHFAIPRTVVFGPLPTTATGKIQKYTLRERARGL